VGKRQGGGEEAVLAATPALTVKCLRMNACLWVHFLQLLWLHLLPILLLSLFLLLPSEPTVEGGRQLAASWHAVQQRQAQRPPRHPQVLQVVGLHAGGCSRARSVGREVSEEGT